MQVNAEGTRNILEACLNARIARIIHVSSVAVISANPAIPLRDDLPYSASNPYGSSKIEAEKIAVGYRKKGLDIAIVRPSFVYGEEEPHLLPRLVRLAGKRLLPVLGKADNRLHLVSVDNVVDVIILCIFKEEALSGTYIVADKKPLTVRRFFEVLAEAQGAKPPLNIPEPVFTLLRHLPIIGRKVSFLKKDRFYSIERIEDILGYTPRINSDEGLRKSVIALKERR
jgi:nucleoside-diphosphate-sugar epimerase